MNNKEVIIFTGAGISTLFDKPTTKKFKDNLMDIYNNPKEGIFYHILRYTDFIDIEYIYEYTKQIVNFGKEKLIPSLPQFLKSESNHNNKENNNDKIKKNIINELKSIVLRVEDYIFDYYRWNNKHNENLKLLYDNLFQLIKKYSNNIVVATTNYDKSIEKFCEETDYEYFDGFHLNKGRHIWKNNNFYLPDSLNAERDIILYKLHGSLNWKEDNQGKIIRDAEESKPSDINYKNSMLIYPTLSSKSYENREPYVTILNEFKKRLMKTDTCIVIGFSFRDETFINLFKEFVESNKLLIIIGKNSKNNFYKQILKKSIDSQDSGDVYIAYFNRERDGIQGHIGFIPYHLEINNIKEITGYIERLLTNKLDKYARSLNQI